MSRFRFRLQRVLDLRAEREKDRARVLGEAVRQESERRDALQEAADRFAQCGEQATGTSGAVTTAGALRNIGLTVRAAADAVEHAERSYERAQKVTNDERDRFGEARKERRVVERLKERRHHAWRENDTRQEQKEQDGLAGPRSARKGTR